MKRDEEKAQNIREAIAVGEEVPKRDVNWLQRYEEALLQPLQAVPAEAVQTENSLESETAGLDFAEEEAPHIEDEIAFTEEADEGASEEGLA